MKKHLDLFELDPLMLSIFRVAIALVWIGILIYRWPEIPDFYTESGMLSGSQAQALSGGHRLSAFFLNSSDGWAYGLFSVGILSGLGMALGIWSNWSAGIAWVICISMINRNDTIFSGGDMYLAVFLFLAIFLPMDEYFALTKIKIRASPYFQFGKSIYVLQVTILYFFAGYLKSGTAWTSGEALNQILHLRLTTTAFGNFLLQFPFLMKVISYSVPWFEMASPLLIIPLASLRRIRWFWIAGIFSMHIGILLAMNVFYLHYACLVALIPLMHFSSKRHEAPPEFSSTAAIAALAFAVSVVLINFQSAGFNVLPKPIFKTAQAVRMDQYWNFFGPQPISKNYWWSIEGRSDHDVRWNFEKLKSSKSQPIEPISLYATKDWAVFFLGLNQLDYAEKMMPLFAQYLCRQSHSRTIHVQKYEKDGLAPLADLGHLSKDYAYDCSRRSAP